jgi:hypothetical protein
LINTKRWESKDHKLHQGELVGQDDSKRGVDVEEGCHQSSIDEEDCHQSSADEEDWHQSGTDAEDSHQPGIDEEEDCHQSSADDEDHYQTSISDHFTQLVATRSAITGHMCQKVLALICWKKGYD